MAPGSPSAHGVDAHLALVGFLEPLAKPDQAALLERRQVTQVPLDVVSVQFVWKETTGPRLGQGTPRPAPHVSCSVMPRVAPRG